MKTKVFVFLLAILPFGLNAQNSLMFKATSNGIAPIPAFTLGKPAGIISLNCKLFNNFEIDPLVGFSLNDGKLWFSDSWLRYNIPMLKGKLIATAGFNFPSYVGEKIEVGGKAINQVTRCLNLQSKFRYIINESNSLVFDYWYIFIPRSIANDSGHYISMVYDWKKELLKKIIVGAEINTFYLTYRGEKPANGFASSIEASLFHKKTGLFFGGQVFVPLTLKSDFSWNVSVGIKRNLF
jgi:hypothetical protein